MSHNPIPYISVTSYASNEDGCFDIISNPDPDTFSYVGEINKKEDVEFITKACNNYYQMLAALKAIVGESQNHGCGSDTMSETLDEVRRVAITAVTQAEELS